MVECSSLRQGPFFGSVPNEASQASLRVDDAWHLIDQTVRDASLLIHQSLMHLRVTVELAPHTPETSRNVYDYDVPCLLKFIFN